MEDISEDDAEYLSETPEVVTLTTEHRVMSDDLIGIIVFGSVLLAILVAHGKWYVQIFTGGY